MREGEVAGVLDVIGSEGELPTSGFILVSFSRAANQGIPKYPRTRSWSVRVWGRTHYFGHLDTRKFTCTTADFGSGNVESACARAGAGAIPLATFAELNDDQGL
ncbi:unnamed protein product [Fraxinus pennsylvanica]|uniref:Uncharacterized protein n=1 Tax=Fraxinus pennsylvanica TaxID=56036 RepID=A0AAD1YZU4_9LAMI|nr:unnamed protein product [Fraxinus pennsylvanica]